jgi:hypothetical protein
MTTIERRLPFKETAEVDISLLKEKETIEATTRVEKKY